MPLIDAERNNLAQTQGARITHISLHTADPTTTGGSEVTGGSYARQPITWGAPSGGTITGTVTFTGMPAATVSHFGGWSAVTAGTFRGGNALSPSRTVLAGDSVQLTLTIPVTASA